MQSQLCKVSYAAAARGSGETPEFKTVFADRGPAYEHAGSCPGVAAQKATLRLYPLLQALFVTSRSRPCHANLK
jgi:hypothetical protein